MCSKTQKLASSCFLFLGLFFTNAGAEGAEGCFVGEDAVSALLGTMPSSNLHLHIERSKDLDVVKCFGENGYIFQLFYKMDHWFDMLADQWTDSYHTRSQHVFFGTLSWTASQMSEVKKIAVLGKLNIEYTHFFYIVQEDPATASLSWTGDTNSTQGPSSPLSVAEKLDQLNHHVLDDLQIVVMFIIAASDTVRNGANLRFAVACREDTPGGSRLAYCGDYKPGKGFVRPLWPHPITNFYGKAFRLTVLKKPTVFFYDAEEDGLEGATGWASELTRWLFDSLNATGVLSETNGFGRLLPDGNWTGMVGQLHRREADMGSLDFSTNPVRYLYIEFSTILSMDYGVILSKAPTTVIKPFLLFQIFTPVMWGLLVFASVLSGIFIGVITATLEGENNHSCWFYLSNGVVLAVRQYVYQQSKWLPKGNSSRFLCFFSFAAAFLVISIYRSSVIAFFAIPFRSTPIDSFEDLFQSDVIPAVRKDTVFHVAAAKADAGFFHELSKRMLLFTDQELSTWKFFKRLSSGELAFFDLLTSALGRSREFEKRGQDCLFYLGKHPVRVDHDAFALRRNTPLIPPVNKMIRQLRSFGVVEELKRRYYSIPCNRKLKANKIASLGLEQMQGAFFLLGFGLLLGGMSLVTELLIRTVKQPSK